MATDPREALKCELLADLLRSGKPARLQVTGASMLPSIWPGDILTICPAELSRVRPGDIALFAREERLVAHRVLRQDGSSLITQGDGLPNADAPVHSSELLGCVVSVERRGTVIKPRTSLSLFGHVIAMLVRHCSLCARALLRIRRARPCDTVIL